jgi:hypothetical protein
MNHLKQRGFFTNPNDEQYYNVVLQDVYNQSEKYVNTDYVVYNQLNSQLTNDFNTSMISQHRQSLINERIRKENVSRMNKEAEEKRIEERQKRKEERLRIKKENEIKSLTTTIINELLKTWELVDDVNDLPVYNINGYHSKGKKYASAIGGMIGQIAIVVSYLQNIIPDILTEDKLGKILETFYHKSPPFVIPYIVEDLEYFKSLDPNIVTIEDIIKCDDTTYNDIVSFLVENTNDELLTHLLDSELKQVYNTILSLLFKQYRSNLTSSDPTNINEKIKFILKDSQLDSFAAICNLIVPVVTKQKNDITVVSKKSKKPQVQPTKTLFEPEFNDKIAIAQSVSEKMKVLLINSPFETALRSNIIECINRLFKLDDKDITLLELETYYKTVYDSFIEKVKTNKDYIDIDLSTITQDP